MTRIAAVHGVLPAHRYQQREITDALAAMCPPGAGAQRRDGHYPVMAALHTGLLAGCLAETWLAPRPFQPLLGRPMPALALGAQALRWWCIGTLGPRWNTRVIVVPGLPLVRTGPYRLLRHPNCLAVVVEGLALPLVRGAWLAATCFTLLNLPLLTVRLRCENAALAHSAPVAANATPPCSTC